MAAASGAAGGGGGGGRAITYLPPGLAPRQVAEAFLRAAELGDLDTWLATLSRGGFGGPGAAAAGGPIAAHGWARTRKRLEDFGARHDFEREEAGGGGGGGGDDARAVHFRATFGAVPGYAQGEPLRPTALQGGGRAVVELVREYGEWRVAGVAHPELAAAAP